MPDVLLTKVGIIVPKTMLSIANGQETDLWFHLIHGSQQEQPFCIKGNPSIPGLLKNVP